MSADQTYAPTPRTVPTRYRERARYDRATVHGILDEALICHVGYINAGRPVVLPTTHARLGETLYLHGSTGSGPMLTAAGSPDGLPVCVTVTLVDGLVLARSAMHHSLEYRSVVAVGNARLVQDRDEKLRCLRGACSITSHPAGPPTAAPPTLANSRRPPCSRSTSSRCPPRCVPAGPSTTRKTSRCRTGRGWCRSPCMRERRSPPTTSIRRVPTAGLPRVLPPRADALIEPWPTTPTSHGW